MRVLSIIIFLFASVVYGVEKEKISIEITQEMVNQCYRDLTNNGYTIKQERLYKGDELVSTLKPELGLISPKCKDQYWAERAKRSHKLAATEKMRMFSLVAGMFDDGRLTICEDCMATIKLTKDDLLQHTAIQCLEKNNSTRQCQCIKEFKVAPDMKVLRHMSDIAGTLKLTDEVESYQLIKSLLENDAPEMAKKFLTCKLEDSFAADCSQFSAAAKMMNDYKKQYPQNKRFKIWMDQFKGATTWKKFSKKLLRKYQAKKDSEKLYRKMSADGHAMCDQQPECKSQVKTYRKKSIAGEGEFKTPAYYVAVKLNALCQYIKQGKDKFCKGELVLSSQDELYFDNNDFIKRLNILSARCHNFLNNSGPRTVEEQALRNLVQDTSEYREHSLPGALDSLEKLVDPNGVEVVNDDLSRKTFTETLKNSFQDFATPKVPQQHAMQETNPFDQVSYNSVLDGQQDEESKKLKAKKVHQQRELTDQERRIEELEKKLAAKTIQQKATTQVSEKNKISDEIEKLLAELKAVKAENIKLRNREIEKVVEKSGVSPSTIATNSNNSNARLATASSSRSGVSKSDAPAVNQGGAGTAGSVGGSAMTSTEGESIAKGQASGDSSTNGSSMFAGTSLLTFSYAEFTKMDKSILYKESNGKPIEIIKKDEHGNPVVYILEPIVNEKGEFVDYRMVKKDELKGKAKKKVVEKPVHKKTKKDEAKNKSRAWYQKLLDVFKQKLQGI